MPKLPARQKVTVVVFRRAGPDEILVVPRESKRVVRWALPSTEVVEGETARDAALQLAEGLVDGEAVTDLDLALDAAYRVAAGPSAGEWTERFFAVETEAGARALEGRWLPHYEAKAQAGAELPRVRDAITRLRETARLKP